MEINDQVFKNLLLVTLLTLPLKGLALWRSARGDSKAWFIALGLINSFGLLDLIFLFYFNKQRPASKDQIEP